VLCLAAVLAAACSRRGPPPLPATPPDRIAAVGPSAFLLTDALYLFPAATNRLVAFSDDIPFGSSRSFAAFFDPALPAKTRLGSTAGPEQTAAAAPQVVLLKSSASRLGAAYEALGIPILYLDLESPEAYDRDLAALGDLLGDPATAGRWRTYYTSIRRRAADFAAAASAASAVPPPRVLLLQLSARGGPAKIPAAGWMQTRLVEMAGGIPVWKDAARTGGWQPVNPEQIAAWDPDVLLLVSYSPLSPDALSALLAAPPWSLLRAVREGRAALFPTDFRSWDLPDVRWGLGLLWTANQLWPAAPPFDLDAETLRFYEALGVPPEKTAAAVLPMLHPEPAP
jgi:iron complex transport system substrate-binding protein